MSEFRRRLMMQVWGVVSKYIKFKDPVVESLCMKWSSDGIGLTPEDAAKVTDIGTTFQGSTEITSFDEFKYFTSITTLSNHVFSHCPYLEVLKLPKSTVTLGNYSFVGCTNLQRVGLSGVHFIGEGAFYQASLKDEDGLRYNEHITALYNHAFQESSLGGDIHLPNLTSIKWWAFARTKITSIRLDSLKIIEAGPIFNNTYGTFGACLELKHVYLPSIEEVGDCTLWNCTGLEYVELGEKVYYIGYRTFYNCKGDLIVKAVDPPTLHHNAFDDSTQILYVPDESVEAYKSATNWSAYADRIKPLSEYQPTNE